jgi:hypothetical protein
LRLVERALVERFFAAVFLPPRDAADLDGARLSPPVALRADVDFFFAADVVFFFVADVFFFAAEVFFFAADVVFLRALLADFERVALDERFAAVFFPPRDAAFFDAAFFDGALLEDARFALDFFADALDFLFEAELDAFFFAADVFLLAAADVFFFADALFFFAAELFFFAPALDDFFRELAPVFVREDALAALVVLDPENAGSLGSGSCSRSPHCSPTVGARLSSRTSACSSSSSLGRSGARSSSESLWVISSYRRSSLSLQSSDISTPWGRLRRSFPHFGVSNASLPSQVARRARADRYSSGGFCTSCSVAYASVSWSTTAMPSPYA